MTRLSFLLPPYTKRHIIILGSITLAAWTGFLVYMWWAPRQAPSTQTAATQVDSDAITVTVAQGEAEVFSATPAAQPVIPSSTPVPVITPNPNKACRVLEAGASAVVSIIGQQDVVAPLNTMTKPSQGTTEICNLTNRVAAQDGADTTPATESAGLMMTTLPSKESAAALFSQLKSATTAVAAAVLDLPTYYDQRHFVVVVQKDAIIYQFYAGDLPPSANSQKTSERLAAICLTAGSITYITETPPAGQ